MSGEGGTVNRDKDLVGPVAGQMDLSSDHFLSDAGLAGYDNGTLSGCYGPDYLKNRMKDGALADEVGVGKPAGRRATKALPASQRCTEIRLNLSWRLFVVRVLFHSASRNLLGDDKKSPSQYIYCLAKCTPSGMMGGAISPNSFD